MSVLCLVSVSWAPDENCPRGVARPPPPSHLLVLGHGIIVAVKSDLANSGES